jgi:hypothetical protein
MPVPWNQTSSSCRMVTLLGYVNMVEICPVGKSNALLLHVPHTIQQVSTFWILLLSAVDMYTCQHILKFCIQDFMIAGGGTVVLANHQTELFALSNLLVVLEDGKQVYGDKYKYPAVKPYFPNLVETSDRIVNKDHKLSSNQMTLVTNQRPRSSKEL